MGSAEADGEEGCDTTALQLNPAEKKKGSAEGSRTSTAQHSMQGERQHDRQTA
jgi:hypothetical protein